MSAYMVDKAHVDALVRAAAERRMNYYWEPAKDRTGSPWVKVTHEERDRIGQLLTDQNRDSVSYRYPDDALTDLPGPLSAWWILPYRYDPRGPILTPVQTLKALDGYAYQACETPDWEATEAHAICDALRDEQIRHLPGYEAAEWAITAEMAAEAPRLVSLFDLAADKSETLIAWTTWRDANIPGGE